MAVLSSIIMMGLKEFQTIKQVSIIGGAMICRKEVAMKKEKALAKIEKAVAKNKSKLIFPLLNKAEPEVMVKALEAMGKLGDEDSRNCITHFLDDPTAEIRVAACKAALVINNEYMKTRVSYQLSVEQDEAVKKEIRDAFNAVNP